MYPLMKYFPWWGQSHEEVFPLKQAHTSVLEINHKIHHTEVLTKVFCSYQWVLIY